jgi:hypothetical protein
MRRAPSRRGWTGLLLALGLFAIYNANGREIGTYDTQPTKLAARAFAQRGTLTLDADVARVPDLAHRPAFVADRQGHVRSAYSPVASIAGGVVGRALAWGGVDLDAPRAPNLIATITASALTAAAVGLVFFTLTRLVSTPLAVMTAIGLGLGTNLWVIHSQTLGEHEMVLFGFALCLFAWTRPTAEVSARYALIGAVGVALAVTARVQTLPLAVMLVAGLAHRLGWRRALGPIGVVVGALGLLVAVQFHWFGHALGAMPALVQLHPEIHDVPGAFNRAPWTGLAGLLLSPNRGLIVYSPIVLIAIAGVVPALRRHDDMGLGWGFAGAALQLVTYATYAVWWGGHSYGPRYALDAIVPLTPAGAIALATVCRGRVARTACVVGLAWSILVAATGAFFSDTWNVAPSDVDRHHARLWDWHEPQISRAWHAGLSPQNFNLFNWTAYRQTTRRSTGVASAPSRPGDATPVTDVVTP